jgi:hypothetical protein
MRRGEICFLTCKPDYAYGRGGVGPIPPNATLIFEVTLLDWTEKRETNEYFTLAVNIVSLCCVGGALFYLLNKMFTSP